ncbi:MAG: phasin [Micavibrio sp.]|nr:phasin [Micavibrio sp.]|tara:strand:- start:5525 stop:5974 length:450 start_codon:yes stop_codon:yes gene_type:complete
MVTNNPFSQLFSQNDFSKAFEQYQTIPFEMNAFMETQRKNIEALTEAQQLAMENMQAVAQRQTEIVSQLIEDNSKIAKELMGEGSPEQKLAKNADLFKKIYEKTTKDLQQLSDMISKSNTEAGQVLNKRISASMGEIKSALEKGNKKAA